MRQQHMRHCYARRNSCFVALGSILILFGAVGCASTVGQGAFPSGGGTSLPITCKTPQHSIGDSNLSIISSGLPRTAIVHLAPSYGRQAQPLVINYHAYTFTAKQMSQYTNMAAEADKVGFILVFPQGLGNPPSWNAGLGTGAADDVQFTRDLLNFVAKNYCVDMQRIYVTGFSLGGGMAYRIACALTDQIAALATVAGAYYPIPGGCHPSHPLAVLEIHGQADSYAPYTGNAAAGMASVQAYLDAWLARDGCNGTNAIVFQQSDVTALQWTHCTGGSTIVHYRVSDGGHTWPGAPAIGLGYTTHAIDANVVLWNFFSRFST